MALLFLHVVRGEVAVRGGALSGDREAPPTTLLAGDSLALEFSSADLEGPDDLASSVRRQLCKLQVAGVCRESRNSQPEDIAVVWCAGSVGETQRRESQRVDAAKSKL